MDQNFAGLFWYGWPVGRVRPEQKLMKLYRPMPMPAFTPVFKIPYVTLYFLSEFFSSSTDDIRCVKYLCIIFSDVTMTSGILTV